MQIIEKALVDNSDRQLMLFDLALGGHHGNYIKYLIDYWCEQDLPGKLDIVVLPEFIQVHTEVVETISQYQHPNIKLIAIAKQQAEALTSRKSSWSRILRNIHEWELYRHYAIELQATHSLIMYLDTCEIPLAVGKQSPCPFSGIYFRPTFHYSQFANYKASWKDKLQQARERITLSRILGHPQLQNIFCLDPLAIKQIEQFSSKSNIVHLPDPIQLEEKFNIPDHHSLRQSLGIERHRQVFLLFGALDGRKGIYQLLDAIAELPSDQCQKLCLQLAGGTNAAVQANIKLKLKPVCQTKPIQIIERYEFIPESEVPAYFQLADLVLAPYQKHVGMSGILLLAAAAAKPVLSSNYGLMGEMVRRYELGLSVDSTIPSEIAKALTQYLMQPTQNLGNRGKMENFAQQNSSDRYSSIIFSSL